MIPNGRDDKDKDKDPFDTPPRKIKITKLESNTDGTLVAGTKNGTDVLEAGLRRGRHRKTLPGCHQALEISERTQEAQDQRGPDHGTLLPEVRAWWDPKQWLHYHDVRRRLPVS